MFLISDETKDVREDVRGEDVTEEAFDRLDRSAWALQFKIPSQSSRAVVS